MVICPTFQWFWSIFGLVKLDFDFAMCFGLVIVKPFEIVLLFS